MERRGIEANEIEKLKDKDLNSIEGGFVVLLIQKFMSKVRITVKMLQISFYKVFTSFKLS